LISSNAQSILSKRASFEVLLDKCWYTNVDYLDSDLAHSPNTPPNTVTALPPEPVLTNNETIASKDDHNHFKLLSINIQSVLAKREAFWELLQHHSPDIVVGYETWLNPSVLDSEIIPTSYTLYRTDRHNGYGGVMMV